MKKFIALALYLCLLLGLTACGGETEVASGVEDGVLTIAMECAYAPYNWTQRDDSMKQVDFAGPYFYASIVCVVKANSPYANAKGLSDLSGGRCTAQIATVWYDSMLPQINGAKIQTAAESAPAMLTALATDTVDFICTDMPTALGAVAAYPDMVILDFSGSDDGFEVDPGEINIGVSLMKGNTVLKEAIDAVLSTMTAADFNKLMDEAIAIQPLSE